MPFGVDVEGDFDLGHAALRRRNSGELELAQSAVLRSHRTLALKDVNFNFGLRIGSRGEGLGLLGGDGGVARDHSRGDSTQRFDGQGQRGHIEQ